MLTKKLLLSLAHNNIQASMPKKPRTGRGVRVDMRKIVQTTDKKTGQVTYQKLKNSEKVKPKSKV